MVLDMSFNSLQTGKPFRTVCNPYHLSPKFLLFQFPSNGKALSDVLNIVLWSIVILFQFPSNGKALSDPVSSVTPADETPVDKFQFPSNGKALSDNGGFLEQWKNG